MNISVYQSEVDTLFSNGNTSVFRLSRDFEFLAIILSKYLTLFHFKKNLTLSIPVQGEPVQIDFLKKQLVAVRFSNRKIVFHRIVVTDYALQLPRIQFQNTGFDLMMLDQIDSRIYLLAENRVFVYHMEENQKAPQLVKEVVLQGAKVTQNTAWCLAKRDSTAPDSLYIVNSNQVDRYLLKLDQMTLEEKPESIATKLNNLVAVYWSQKGYALVINSKLEVDLICYGISKGISHQLKNQIKSSSPFTKDSIQFSSVDNVKDLLFVYCQEQFCLNIFDLEGIKKNGQTITFSNRLRVVKLTERMEKFDTACDATNDIILYFNETGLKNLKIKPKPVQPEPQVKQPPAEFKPKKVKQRQSKVLKHVNQPSVPSEPFSKGPESQKKIVDYFPKETKQSVPSNTSQYVQKTEQKSTVQQPTKKQEPKVQKKVEFAPTFIQKPLQKEKVMPPGNILQTQFNSSTTNTQRSKSQMKQQVKKETNVAKPPKHQTSDSGYQMNKEDFEEQISENDADRIVQEYMKKMQNSFNLQVTSFENKMKGVIATQTNRVSEEVSKVGTKLTDQLTNTVVRNTKQSLMKYIQQDLEAKIEVYFQQIFKKIGQTHQQGINYYNEQQRLQKQKFDKLDNQGVLLTLAKIEGVLNQIKKQSENGAAESFQKSMLQISAQMSELSQAIEGTLEKQTILSNTEANKSQQILDKLSQLLKIVGKEEEAKAVKRKKFLLIRRPT